MSCWLHRPVVCSAHLPAAALKPSLTRCTNAQLSHEHLHCSLHTFRHNIYNCTWPWSIALFQINDHTIYLLGFCTFSVLRPELQLCPNSSQESVVEPFMEALNSQHRAGLATRAVPSPSPSTGTSAQVTAREPLVCFSCHGCPILLLLMHWGPSSPAVQMCCWVTRWGHSH